MTNKKSSSKFKSSLRIRRFIENVLTLLIDGINYEVSLSYQISGIRQLLFESSVVAYTTAIATCEIATIFFIDLEELLNFSKFLMKKSVDRRLERKLKSIVRMQMQMLRYNHELN